MCNTVLNCREASYLERRVLEAVGLHQHQDLRSDGIIPHIVEWCVEDAVGSLGGDLEGVGSRRGMGKGMVLN
jgi:hypothetical protein